MVMSTPQAILAHHLYTAPALLLSLLVPHQKPKAHNPSKSWVSLGPREVPVSRLSQQEVPQRGLAQRYNLLDQLKEGQACWTVVDFVGGSSVASLWKCPRSTGMRM